MASQLRLMYAQYMERAKLNLPEFYKNKLKVGGAITLHPLLLLSSLLTLFVGTSR